MKTRLARLTTVLLALLVAVSSCVVLPAQAEAQMRCAGASAQSAPCARVAVPANENNPAHIYGMLMSCCRVKGSGCTNMQNCPMKRIAGQITSHKHGLSPIQTARTASACLVTVRTTDTVTTATTAPRPQSPFTIAPASLPVIAARLVSPLFDIKALTHWTLAFALPEHNTPSLHGLRAPPAA